MQKRIALWLLVSLAVMPAFSKSFWSDFAGAFSYDFIFGRHHAAPYGMLVLCLLFLISKRAALKNEMTLRNDTKDVPFIIGGLALIATAILLPAGEQGVLLKPALVLAGSFALIFGRAARYPLITLGVYIVSTSFPLLVELYAEEAYAGGTVSSVKAITAFMGLPLAFKGQLISFFASTGDPVTVAVTSACAGPATMGVFLGLFALMYLDNPIPAKRTAAVLFLGIAGTWMQSVIRILVLLEAGIQFGEDALWTAHFWTIYLLFPVWYMIFAIIYLKQAGGIRLSRAA